MQNISVQMTSRRAMKESNSISASSSKQKNAVSEELADPFLQIIMSIIAQFQENSEPKKQYSEGTMPETNALMEAGTPINPENLPELLSFLNSQGLQIGQENPLLQNIGFSDASVPIDVISQLMSQVQTSETDYTDSPFLAQLINMSETTNVVSGENEAKQFSSFADIPEFSGMVFEKSTDASDSDTLTPLLTKNNFMEAVVAVKEKLSKSEVNPRETAKTNETVLDVDAIQNEVVQNKAFSPFELSFKTAPESTETQLIDQISTSIKQNVNLGKSEFTVKLKPESLGLITVKLVEKAGKTTLTITAASAQTAKLINSDLNSLREAIAPMNVHVNEAVIQTDASEQGNMQQFNMAGQQFAGQQFDGRQNFSGFENTSSSNRDDVYLPDMPDEVPVTATPSEAADGLDTYI